MSDDAILVSLVVTGYAQPGAMASGQYPYMRIPGMKDDDKLGGSLQDMDAERTVRRARRNRTCFTRQQVRSLSSCQHAA